MSSWVVEKRCVVLCNLKSIGNSGFGGGLGWFLEAVCSDSWVWRRSGEGSRATTAKARQETKQGARSSPSSCIGGRKHVRRIVWRLLEISFANRIWCFGSRLEVVYKQLCD